jgi:dTDP-4-dehydrorhamnose 3,5-epimerase
MEIRPLEIPGAFEIVPSRHCDQRGYFVRLYDEDTFAAAGLQTRWLQDNESRSQGEGIVRGLHFQRPPHTETKLVRAAVGEAMDVLVDLRIGSPTFGRWAAVQLSSSIGNMVYVPRGCAHGFCTTSPDTLICYKVDAVYAPQAEGGLFWNDPAIGIDWPVGPDEAILSEKDRNNLPLEDIDSPFRFGQI